MWLAVSVIESTADGAEPSAGLEPTNLIGGGGGGGATHAVPSELIRSGRTHASCAGVDGGAGPVIAIVWPRNVAAALPARSLIALPE